MLEKVNSNMMKKFIISSNTALDKQYIENHAEKLVKTLDERLDDIIYEYCQTGKKKDFSFTQNSETFSVYEIMAMRSCSFYESVLLMDGFIKDAKAGRHSIMRR